MNNEQTFITLNDGNKIPQLGIGTFMIHGDAATEQACLTALKSGYRHIDTAHAYYNEGGVGQAVRNSGIPREEIWITSKLWPSEYGEGVTLRAIDQMLKRLDTNYIDLLLLHQPHGDYIGAWRDMEKAVKAGKIRSIGLSNFERKFDEVARIATIKPAIIQVECHPYYPQHQLKEHVAAYGTRLESWYPLGHADSHLLNEPVFSKLAKKYGKSNVQIILRWHIQEGNIVFPKSTNPEHIKSNLDIFDFELTDEEMNKIKALDKNQRFYPMS